MISLVACLALALPGQVVEYYRVLIEDIATEISSSSATSIFIYCFSGSSLILMSCALAYCASVLIVQSGWIARLRRQRLRRRAWLIPTIVGVLPILGLIVGVLESFSSFDVERAENAIMAARELGADRHADQLKIIVSWTKKIDPYFVLTFSILIGLVVVFALLGLLASFWYLGRPSLAKKRASHSHMLRSLRYSIAITAVLIIVVAFVPVEIGQTFGALSIFAIFICCLTFNFTGMAFASREYDFPFVSALIVVAVALALFDLNDNHRLRRVETEASTQQASSKHTTPPDLSEAFVKWYHSRPDKDLPEYQRDGYPVFIVAAQGGGIYAAAQSLLFLTELQASCERFAQHLFAISSVSGGSVGSAFYSALASHFDPTKEQCRRVEDAIDKPPRVKALRTARQAAFELIRNDYDFLSPVVASALFPDFFQRFIWPPIPPLSRARALEYALERAWSSVDKKKFGGNNGSLLGQGMLSSWDAKGIRPAIVFNTTEVGSGRRRLIAPFTFAAGDRNDLRFLPISRSRDVALSSAAVASARFPWLTPAAWFRDGWSRTKNAAEQKTKSNATGDRDQRESDVGAAGANSRPTVKIVDGGYFENSGVPTAVDVIDRLEQIAKRNNITVQIVLLVISSGDYPKGTSSYFAEALTPVRTFFKSWQSRSFSTVEFTERKLGALDVSRMAKPTTIGEIPRLQQTQFKEFIVPLQLGWRLSKVAATQIFFTTGRLKSCRPTPDFQQSATIEAFGASDCVKLLVFHMLRGDDLSVAFAAAQQRAKR